MDLIIHGDCLEELTKLEDESVDLIATDPPYGLSEGSGESGYMGMVWDATVPSTEVWSECLRVLKPGAFMFVMSSPRQDVLAQMIMNVAASGFDIRTTPLWWLYTSGRPVAVDVSKAVDAKLGVEREVVATIRRESGWKWQNKRNAEEGYRPKDYSRDGTEMEITRPTSDEAKALDGAYSHFKPKPACEVVIVAKKPNAEPSAVAQAMANGKGVTWLDDARIPFASDADERSVSVSYMNAESTGGEAPPAPKGRFPANILCSDQMLGDLSKYFDLDAWWEKTRDELPPEVSAILPAIYCKKAGIAEKGAYNKHPTVKPVRLMCYLITLASRPGGVVLDPFAGSGTSLVAAKILSRSYIGIEQNADYLALIERRLSEWKDVSDLDVKRSNHREKNVGYEFEPFV